MSQPRIDYRLPTINSNRKSPTHNLYTDSSYISQYLAHSKKIYDLPSSIKRSHFNVSPQSTLLRDYKGLAKNYIQNKYLILQEGNQQQRAGWRRYLLDGFKAKVQGIMLNKCSKAQKFKKHFATKSIIQQSTATQQDYMCVNEIIQKKVPSLDMDKVEATIIKQNEHVFRLNIDYDEKLKRIMKQFEIIVMRIENEAFKLKIPDNFETNMQNYNDFYSVDMGKSNPYYSPRLYNKSDEYFKSESKFQKSSGGKFFESYYDEEIEIQRVEIVQIEEEERQTSKHTDEMIAIPFIGELNLGNININIEQQETGRSRNTERSQFSNRTNKIKYSKCQKQEERMSVEERRQIIENKEQDYGIIDYLIKLDDVFEAKLEQLQEHHYDSYIFVDPDEEIIYKCGVDWNDKILLLLNQQ